MDDYVKIHITSLVQVWNELQILRANEDQLKSTINDYRCRIGALNEKLKSTELLIEELKKEKSGRCV